MDNLVNAIKAVGVALVVAFSASIGIGFVASLGTMLRGISAITAIVGLGALPKWLIAASGAAAKFLPALRAIVLLGSAVVGIFVANQIFDDFASVALNAFQRISEAVLRLGADILDFIGTPIQKMMTLLNGGKDVGGMGQGITMLADKLKSVREESEKTAQQLKKDNQSETQRLLNRSNANKPVVANVETVREVDTTARDNAIKQIREMNKEYEKSRLSVLGRLELETLLVGKSEEEKQLLSEQRNLALEYQQAQEALIKRRETLGKEEKYLAGVINEQIKKNADGYAQQFEQLTKTVTAQQTANILEKDRLANIERMTQAYEKQQKIQEAVGNFQRSLITAQKETEFQGAQQKRSPFERQVADIKEQSKKAAQEAATAFSAAFDDGGDGMGAETAKQFADGLAKIYDGYKKIEEQQVAQLEYSKTWQAGWEEAFNAYKENSQDSADTAKQAFTTFTSGIEDAFVKFVQTGKLSFKDLINSMIADFAKLQAKKALSGLMDMGGGAGGGFGSLFGGIGKLFGFADGGNPPMGKASIVGERGAELLIPRNASTVVPLDGLGGGGSTNVTYNINANDASSFKQMLAREPEFLFAVTESGRRNMPTRSRR
jgi:hypothetical protein